MSADSSAATGRSDCQHEARAICQALGTARQSHPEINAYGLAAAMRAWAAQAPLCPRMRQQLERSLGRALACGANANGCAQIISEATAEAGRYEAAEIRRQDGIRHA